MPAINFQKIMCTLVCEFDQFNEQKFIKYLYTFIIVYVTKWKTALLPFLRIYSTDDRRTGTKLNALHRH